MIQTAVGGNRMNNAYVEPVVRGATSRFCRFGARAADMAGGFIASCRNPVPASYVKQHAALGGILASRSRWARLSSPPNPGAARL